MSVDPDLVRNDMYLPEVGPLDERVVRGGWTFYVHATRRSEQLGRASVDGTLGLQLTGALIELFKDWRARNNPIMVGIVRLGYIGSFNSQSPVVVHREWPEVGADPAQRVAELVAEIKQGRFDPED